MFNCLASCSRESRELERNFERNSANRQELYLMQILSLQEKYLVV